MFSLHRVVFKYGNGGRESAPDGMGGIEVDELTIQTGHVTAIIGPSGSGKTTLLSILAGFLAPEIKSEGHFTFQDEPIGALGHPPGRISFVFQSPMMLGAASGIVNGLQGCVMRHQSGAASELSLRDMSEAAQGLNLTPAHNVSLLSKRSRSFSGGEAQRVAILRALWANPNVILCDEPTSSLDELNACLAMTALRNWSRKNSRSVVWVTHNLEQAAEFATKFVFVSKGQILLPTETELEVLEAGDEADKLFLLKTISKRLQGQTGDPNGVELSDVPDEQVALSPRRYAAWIARALSTDGINSARVETRNATELIPTDQAQMLHALGVVESPSPIRHSLGRSLRGLWNIFRTYSRYGVALILTVMTAQILTAHALGGLVHDYAEQQLQDPSVARIVFERVLSSGLSDREAEELELTPFRIGGLENFIRAELGPETTPQDLARVRIEGRRLLVGSRLAFPQAGDPRCVNGADIETHVLNRDDPLLQRAKLSAEPHVPMSTMDEVIAEAEARATRDVDGGLAPHIGIVDARLMEGMIMRCGFDPQSQAGSVLWYPGHGTFVEIELVAAMVETPPLYPGNAELIVFTYDYESALNKLNRVPDPPSTATAYFPLEAFDLVTQILRTEGYRLRDDSAALVETLQEIKGLAEIAPFVVILLSAFVCAIVIVIAMDAILEINKRVIALFLAHQMMMRHMLLALLLHLLPALCVAIVVSAAITGCSLLIGLTFRVLPDESPAFWAQGVMISAVYLAITSSLATFVVLRIWWGRARNKLKGLLQD